MKLRRVYPGVLTEIDLDGPGARARLLEWYAPESGNGIRLNLVASINGSAVGSDGTSETLANASDRLILGVIRELGDTVLVGAATVRSEGYRIPRRSRLAILTSSGNLTGHRLDSERIDQVTVICSAAVADRVRDSLPGAQLSIVADSDGTIAMTEVIAALHASGQRSIVCEGGPSLASELIKAGLVSELCLTTSPVLRELELPLLGHAQLPEQHLILRHIIVDEAGFVFARWAIPNAAATG